MKRVQIRAILLIFILLAGCNKVGDLFSTEDKQISENESAQESTMNELDDMATSILDSHADSGPAGGRTVGAADDRFACAGVSVQFTDVGTDKTWGTVTVTFPADGCTDKKGNIRKGIIRIKWSGGRWYKPGSTYTISLDGYSINDINIVGSQTVTCTSYQASPLTVTWSVSAKHTATWPDGTTASRNVKKTRKWEHTATDDIFTITNGVSGMNCAEGTNRHGNTFKVFITTPLVYLGSCARASKVFIPISGEKVITHSSSNGKTKSLTIGYGDGTCDNTFVATSGAVTKTLTAKNDSSGD